MKAIARIESAEHDWHMRGETTLTIKARVPYGTPQPSGDFEIDIPPTDPLEKMTKWLKKNPDVLAALIEAFEKGRR